MDKKLAFREQMNPQFSFLIRGTHTVELRGPNGMSWVKDINVVKYVQECVCLKIVDTETKTPCPYDIKLDAPSVVNEGDLVTFGNLERCQNA